MNVTLLEVHLDDATFSANAPFSGTESSDTSEHDADERADQPSSSPSAVGAVVGLLALAFIALAARKLLRRDRGSTRVDQAPESEPVTA